MSPPGSGWGVELGRAASLAVTGYTPSPGSDELEFEVMP